MKVYYHTAEAAGKIKKAVVTTGSFDGVHIGHKLIINRLNEIAAEIGGESVLITFYPHPRKVLYPEKENLKMINSQEEKIMLLQKAGLQNLIIIPFSLEFSKTSSRDFVVNMLLGHLEARVIVVGHNHHFGYARKGDYSYLYQLSREMHFGVEEIPLKMIENETVSSTKIRKALTEGNIQRANAYLDHQYIAIGKTGKNGNLPYSGAEQVLSLTIDSEEKIIPPPGIYATNLFVNDLCMKAMTFIYFKEYQQQIDNVLIYDELTVEETKGMLYFYKRVWAEDPIRNGQMNTMALLEAKEMVEELIY
ncbi:MAG: riboflavin biosynthesis protein RibF [Bacteroidia bacterium]|nr:MAG: riboflavin biosynthesis protein RibF [Bacteroidia bacterium]